MAARNQRISLLLFYFLVIIINISSLAEENKSTELVERLLRLLKDERDTELSEAKEIDIRGFSMNSCQGRALMLTATRGTISTPGYGTHLYPDNARCGWKIVSDNTKAQIKLKFKTPFAIEKGPRCAYDSLSIYDGTSSSGKLVGRYCNSNPPPVTIIRDINTVYLEFRSDFSRAGVGFTLDYTILPGPAVEETSACKGQHLDTITRLSGTLTSQNYPKNYDDDLNCSWLIKFPEGMLVHLDFQDFDVENDIGACSYDSLSVYDGDSPNAQKLIGKYCGKQIPNDMTTSTNTVFLSFKSDSSINRKGFSIHFSAIKVTTPVPEPGKPAPTQPTGPLVDLNCTFEEGNMCMWARGAGSNIDWKLKAAKENTFIISNGERWGNKDHTLDNSNGHYIVIDGSESVRMSNTRGYLISPLLSPGPQDGRCLTLWYNMYYTKGVLQVVMRREDEKDEVIFQRDGFQGNGWHRGRVSLVSSAPFRLVLVGSRGTTDKETGIAVDDISFDNAPCLPIALDCGQRLESRSLPDDLLQLADGEVARRILGGQASSVGMWPWIVNIRTTPPGSDRFMACGGSLIDREWVITAAHCFEYNGKWLTNPINIELRLGEANVGRAAWEESQINIRPAKVIIHPQRSQQSMGQVAPYDLALIKLPHKVTLTPEVNVVCLPPANRVFRPGANCVVSGWGKTEEGNVEGSEQLLHVNLELLNTRMCRQYFGSDIGNDVICAKHKRQVKAACRGDSGGPLVCESGDHYILAGVVSWGVPCSMHNQPLPSVFARITYYLPWIESTINSEQ